MGQEAQPRSGLAAAQDSVSMMLRPGESLRSGGILLAIVHPDDVGMKAVY